MEKKKSCKKRVWVDVLVSYPSGLVMPGHEHAEAPGDFFSSVRGSVVLFFGTETQLGSFQACFSGQFLLHP